jgi:hypothetical protein
MFAQRNALMAVAELTRGEAFPSQKYWNLSTKQCLLWNTKFYTSVQLHSQPLLAAEWDFNFRLSDCDVLTFLQGSSGKGATKHSAGQRLCSWQLDLTRNQAGPTQQHANHGWRRMGCSFRSDLAPLKCDEKNFRHAEHNLLSTLRREMKS